jgi:hypothetical protein
VKFVKSAYIKIPIEAHVCLHEILSVSTACSRCSVVGGAVGSRMEFDFTRHRTVNVPHAHTSVRPAWRGETEGAGGALFCAVVAMHGLSCVNTEVSYSSPATQTPRSLLAESTRCHRLRKQETRITGTRLRDLERNWQLSRARECGVHTKDTHNSSSIHARQVVHGS